VHISTEGRRGTWTLVATGLGLFMVFLDAMIVNVAIPDIQREFDADESGMQWIVAAYSLTMAMFMMSGATFGDLRGRRLAYLGGIVLFSVSSVACGLAPDLVFLSAARGAQGVGAAIVNVASLALVGAAYPDPAAKAKAIGIWTGIAAIGLVLGPTLGGVLTEQIGWRSIFLFNPVIGAVAVLLTMRHVAESRDPVARGFDPAGQGLFIVGIGALTFALIQAPHLGWLSAAILGSFGLAAAMLVAFVVVELRSRDPMMDVRVFASRVYSTAIYAVFAVLFCVYGALFIVTQYFQNVHEYSPEKTGFLLLAMSIPTAVLSPVSGHLVATRGARGPALAGLAFAVLGTGLLATTSASYVPVTLAGLACLGAAGGLAVAAVTSEAMGAISPDRSGMASGILSSQRALGSTAGFAIMGSILAATLSMGLPDRLEPLLPNEAQRSDVVDRVVDGANPHAFTALIGPGRALPDEVKTDDDILEETEDAFVDGIRIAMLVGCAVALSALVLGWFLFPRPAPSRAAAVEAGGT
jgi:EmrB/QacA subfamily drug resistance transporter